MPKSKACHHPLSEGSHSLQGDKHKKQFVRGDIWYQCCIQKKRFFLFIALRLMQNLTGWWCSWLKSLSLLWRFLSAAASMTPKRHYTPSARGYFCFCFLADVGFSWWVFFSSHACSSVSLLSSPSLFLCTPVVVCKMKNGSGPNFIRLYRTCLCVFAYIWF